MIQYCAGLGNLWCGVGLVVCMCSPDVLGAGRGAYGWGLLWEWAVVAVCGDCICCGVWWLVRLFWRRAEVW